MAAARQFSAKQQWEQGFDKIDADPSLTAEQKDAAKTRLTMRLAPSMGIPGTEAAAMLHEMRPPKATTPASVTDKGEYWQVTQPTGNVTIHAKGRGAAAHDPNVKVILSKGIDSVPTSMPRSQAIQVIKELPPEIRAHPVNMGVLKGAVAEMQKGLPASGSPAANAEGSRVRVRAPNGQIGTIDSDKLEAALKAGYKRLD
jgi:hypothetical protein